MKTHILIDTAKFSNKTQHLSMINTLRKLGIEENILNLINSIKNNKTHTHTTLNVTTKCEKLSLKQGEDV